MGLIPQVKCGRCDRTYSGLRSRCPYCGAHRHKKGKRVSDGDNATWKLIIGILLIVVLIAAVIVIIVTSPKDAKDPSDTKGGGTSGPNNLPGNNPNDTDPEGSTKITVTLADGTTVTSLTLSPDGTVDLTAVVTSADAVTDVPVWTSSDESVVKVEATDDTGLKLRVTGVAVGNAAITGKVGDAKVDIGITCVDSSDPGPGTTTPPSGTVLASGITVANQFSKGKAVTDFTLYVGEKVTCTATITPSTATGKVTWTVSDSSGLEIVPTDDTGVKVKVTCLKAVGTVTVTAEIDGVSYSFLIRCRKK